MTKSHCYHHRPIFRNTNPRWRNRRYKYLNKKSKFKKAGTDSFNLGLLRTVNNPRSSNQLNSTRVKSTPRNLFQSTKQSSIICVVEGRGQCSGEIGIAALNTTSPLIEISQYHDTSSYSHTSVKLLVLNPVEILVPQSALEPGSAMTKLVRVLKSFKKGSSLTPVPRSKFNDREGFLELCRLCHREYLPSVYTAKDRFYAMTAAAGLLHYIRQIRFHIHAPGSLKFRSTGSLQTTMIDIDSVNSLELIANRRDSSTRGSFFEAINYTCTVGGGQLLRSNIVEPPTDLLTISNRQEAVVELASNPVTLMALQNILRQVPNIDTLLSTCALLSPDESGQSLTLAQTPSSPSLLLHSSQRLLTQQPAPPTTGGQVQIGGTGLSTSTPDADAASPASTSSARAVGPASWLLQCQWAVEARIAKAISLKSLLDLVTPLQQLIARSNSFLLVKFSEYLLDPGYNTLREKLCMVLHEDVRLSKGSLAMRSQRCFAIKEGINVVLDVSRRAYSEHIDDISAEISKLAHLHKLPLRLAFNNARNFYIQFAESAAMKRQGHPTGLADSTSSDYNSSQPMNRSNDSLNTSDPDVTSSQQPERRSLSGPKLSPDFIKVTVNRGIVNCTTDCLIRLNERVKGALQEVYHIADHIRPEMSLLYRLAEIVYSLDFLSSLARMSLREGRNLAFVCPQFSDRIAVKNGRNIVIDHRPNAIAVPNHTYAASDMKLLLITGSSMSGKTSYLRQIAYMQILAQMGSLVPADFAMFRVCDQIFFHTITGDSLASNESSFTKGMRQVSYILRNFTDSSLILIDGLCRGTNTQEAKPLAFAICEELLTKDVSFVEVNLSLTTQAFTFLATNHNSLEPLSKRHECVEGFYFQMTDNRHGDRLASHQASSHLTSTHKLLRGYRRPEKYAIHCLRITSIPESVIDRMQELLRRFKHRADDSNISLSMNETGGALNEESKLRATSNSFNRRHDVDLDSSTSLPQDVGSVGHQPTSNNLRRREQRQLTRQLTLVAKMLTNQLVNESSSVDSSPYLAELLDYIDFLKDRYKSVVGGDDRQVAEE